MANCATLISYGISNSCSRAFAGGGLTQIWLFNKSQFVSATQDGNGKITALSVTGSVYDYDFARNSGNYTETLQGNDSKNYLQSLGFRFGGGILTPLVIQQLEALALGTFMAIVLKNKTYFLVGDDGYGLTSITQEDNSGTAESDEASINIVLTNVNYGKAPIIDSTVAETLLNGPAGTSGGQI